MQLTPMRMMNVFAVVTLIFSFLRPTQVLACSFAYQHHTSQEIQRMAAAALSASTTVIDGEVISPMFFPAPEGTLPVAYIKVSHTWKGQADDGFAAVAYFSSCDLPLVIKGQKVRILLNGTGIFTADAFANGAEAFEQRAVFNREIDRILGTPRAADFTDPGQPPPPER
jgi:hypothetical protein